MKEVEELPLEQINQADLNAPGVNLKRLIAKYGSTSLFTTAIDFYVFHCLLTYLGSGVILATAGGRISGSCTSFFLHRNWVFRHAGKLKFRSLIVKYVGGILLGLFLNMGGVWILNSILLLDPWPSRIITALTVWFIGLYFNKKIVFNIT